MKNTKTIERIDLPSKADFTKFYAAASRPVIFTNVVNQWEAFKLWNPSYFKERYGSVEVFVQTAEILTGDKKGMVKTVYNKQQFGTYVDKLLDGASNCGYLQQYPIFDQFPALQEHVDFPEIYWSKCFSWIEALLGPPKTKSKLHLDGLENLFAQIFGRKRIILISPKFYESCYPVNTSWEDTYSPVDVEHPDYDKFPRFRDVEYSETVLEPGEFLYIPSNWWHDVRSLEVSMNVNMWWARPTMEGLGKVCHLLSESLTGNWYPYTIDKSMVQKN